MIILRVACDNLYMFKNFEVDFTYKRKNNHYITENDVLFIDSKIKVRKNLIIMGSNASGKTAFGKLLCLIFNFIKGKDLNDGPFNISLIQYNKCKDSSFEIEFVIDDTAYLLKVQFRNGNLYTEELFKQKIYRSYSIQTLRKKLVNSKPISFFNIVNDIGCKSCSKELINLRKKITFLFSFSEFSLCHNIKLLNNVLPKIDNRILSVKRLTNTDSIQINFKNNKTLIVSNNNFGNKLSRGILETIHFLFIFNELNKEISNFFYIDECFSHMDCELKAYFIYQAFLKKPFDSQIFFTACDTELLELNVPLSTFLFFKRNKAGFNESVYPSEVLLKHKYKRSLRTYYENDYFDTLPSCNNLDKFFN